MSLEAYHIRVGLFTSVQLHYHSSVEHCGISPVGSRSECRGTGSLRLTLLTVLCLTSASLMLRCGDIHPHLGLAQRENGQPSITLLFPECSPCAGQVSRTCLLCATEFHEESAFWHHLNVEHVSRHSFPSAGFLEDHGRNVFSTCGCVYARRWKFCRCTFVDEFVYRSKLFLKL